MQTVYLRARRQGNGMGEVRIPVKLTDAVAEGLRRRKKLSAKEIRSVRSDALVERGQTCPPKMRTKKEEHHKVCFTKLKLADKAVRAPVTSKLLHFGRVKSPAESVR